MLWLTWRQHRAQALVTALLIAGLAQLLVLDSIPLDLVKTLPWTPVLAGLFWGVPLLAREYERGTDCLVWTQSVSRGRWLAVKFAALGVAVAMAGLALGAVVLAWTASADVPMDRFSGDLFGVSGIAPAAWFLAAFALGAASGAVLRRMLPAMAVTIGVFAALVVGAYVARDHYAEPEVAVGTPVPADAKIVSWGEQNAVGDRQYTRYQPADRYWRFQWTETGLLLLVTVALAGVTARQVLSRSR